MLNKRESAWDKGISNHKSTCLPTPISHHMRTNGGHSHVPRAYITSLGYFFYFKMHNVCACMVTDNNILAMGYILEIEYDSQCCRDFTVLSLRGASPRDCIIHTACDCQLMRPKIAQLSSDDLIILVRST